jgi:hypothetical protein
MIEVTLYGDVKTKVMEQFPDVSSIMTLEYVEGEQFQELLGRLGLSMEHVGDCYINIKPAKPDTVLHDHDSIELNQNQ